MPTWLELGCRAVPLPVAQMALRHLVLAIVRGHPEALARMGPYAGAVFLIAPSDIPMHFHIRLNSSMPVICRRGPVTSRWDARIAGPFLSLLAMVQGTLDGDALFFSRQITIEGDTDAVLALRNAIDAAEIDLPHEAAGLFGPFSPAARRLARLAAPLSARLFQTVTRQEVSAP